MTGLTFGHHGLAHRGLGVHHLVVLTTTLRIGTATAARLLILKTQIAAAGTQLSAVKHLRAGGDGRIPIKRHGTLPLADTHLVTRLRSQPAQLVLDAKLGESVGQIADGLVIVEIGLHHPTFGLRAGHLVPETAIALLAGHGEIGSAVRSRTATIRPVLQRIDDDARLLLGLLAAGDLLPHVGDHGRQRKVQLLQPLMRSRGDLEHLQSHTFEVRAHEIGELLGLRHIHLVEHDDARAFRNRDGAQRQFQLVGVFGELMLQRMVVGNRVAARLQRRAVDDVGDDLRALDVAQELQSQTLALRCAGNQAGHVGDGIAVVACDDDTQVRHQRGERVVGDLRLGGAHRGDQARLAGRREAH